MILQGIIFLKVVILFMFFTLLVVMMLKQCSYVEMMIFEAQLLLDNGVVNISLGSDTGVEQGSW